MRKIEGLKEVLADLDAIGKGLTTKEVKKILVKNVQPILQTMKSLVSENTGRLKNSIKVLVENDDAYPYTIIVGPDFTPDGKGTITIKALTSIQEYGAAERFPRKGSNYIRTQINGKWVTVESIKAIPARPFIRPAMDKHREGVSENIMNDFLALVKKKSTKNVEFNG